MSPPIPVVLLKSSSRSCSTSAPDPYAHLLSQPSSSSSRAPSYSPAFLEVFETSLVDDGELERVLLGGSQRWRGVVVSSGRSVEAWKQAGERLASAEPHGKGKGRARDEDEDEGASSSQPWSRIPFFSIGPSTTTGLLALEQTIPSRLCPSESSVVGTDSAGNTPALARVILDHFAGAAASDDRDDGGRPLLYLTGDKNSTVLAETLASHTPPLALVPLQVYSTSASPAFASSFSALLSALPIDVRPWLVIFSPSALPLLLPILRARPEGLAHWRFALIGPTTESAWVSETADDPGLKWIVAPKPTASALVSALRTKDGLL